MIERIQPWLVDSTPQQNISRTSKTSKSDIFDAKTEHYFEEESTRDLVCFPCRLPCLMAWKDQMGIITSQNMKTKQVLDSGSPTLRLNKCRWYVSILMPRLRYDTFKLHLQPHKPLSRVHIHDAQRASSLHPLKKSRLLKECTPQLCIQKLINTSFNWFI